MNSQNVVVFSRCSYTKLRRRKAAALKRKYASRQRRLQFLRRQTQERLLFAIVMSLLAGSLCKTERLLWSKERSSYWWEFIVNKTFSRSDRLDNFRMSQATFDILCDELRTSIQKVDTDMRKAVPVKQRVGITLWYLATNSDYRTIGHLFGVSKATVCCVIKEVCESIVSVLLPRYISVPSGDGLRAVVDGFTNSLGFPQCAGVVDGTHIPIVSPVDYPADYFNRKGFHSIIMQGMVDNLGRFTDVCIGWPGRVHDARVFVNSSLYHRGQQGTLFPGWKQTICGQDIPLLVLGDPAYPLLSWLLKAYIDNGSLTAQQKLFNYRLSKARVVVEHAYGRLKGRWRCLLKRNDVMIRDLPCLVAACCVLHNICETHHEAFNDDWIQDDPNSLSNSQNSQSQSNSQNSQSQATSTVLNNGKEIQLALMSYFSQ